MQIRRISVLLMSLSSFAVYAAAPVILDAELGDRSRPNPLTPYASLAKPVDGENSSSKIVATEGCKSLADWEPIFVSEELWRVVGGNSTANGGGPANVGVLVLDGQVNCAKAGVPMRVARFDRESGLSIDLGWFFPTALHPRRALYKSQEEALIHVAGLSSAADANIVMVSGRVIMNVGNPAATIRYAPRLQGARVLTRDQMEAAIARGDQIIDVRLKKVFDAGHVKGAKQVPYSIGTRAKAFDTYANYPKAGDAFDIRRINSDKEKPVILMGADATSAEPYRAAVVLRSEGWKKIFIFTEGFEYFAK